MSERCEVVSVMDRILSEEKEVHIEVEDTGVEGTEIPIKVGDSIKLRAPKRIVVEEKEHDKCRLSPEFGDSEINHWQQFIKGEYSVNDKSVYKLKEKIYELDEKMILNLMDKNKKHDDDDAMSDLLPRPHSGPPLLVASEPLCQPCHSGSQNLRRVTWSYKMDVDPARLWYPRHSDLVLEDFLESDNVVHNRGCSYYHQYDRELQFRMHNLSPIPTIKEEVEDEEENEPSMEYNNISTGDATVHGKYISPTSSRSSVIVPPLDLSSITESTSPFSTATSEDPSKTFKVDSTTFRKESTTTFRKNPTTFRKDPTTTFRKDSTTFRKECTTFKKDPTTFRKDPSTFRKDSTITFRKDPSTFRKDSTTTFRKNSTTFRKHCTTFRKDSTTTFRKESTITFRKDPTTPKTSCFGGLWRKIKKMFRGNK